MAIERRVPEPAGARVVGMGDSDELSAQPRTKVLDVGGVESQLPAVEPDGGNVRAAVRGECAMEGNGGGAERRESPCTEASSSHVATPQRHAMSCERAPRAPARSSAGLPCRSGAVQRPRAVHSRSARPPSVTRLWHTDTRLERLAPFVAGARLMIDDTGARVGDLARSKGAAR